MDFFSLENPQDALGGVIEDFYYVAEQLHNTSCQNSNDDFSKKDLETLYRELYKHCDQIINTYRDEDFDLTAIIEKMVEVFIQGLKKNNFVLMRSSAGVFMLLTKIYTPNTTLKSLPTIGDYITPLSTYVRTYSDWEELDGKLFLERCPNQSKPFETEVDEKYSCLGDIDAFVLYWISLLQLTPFVIRDEVLDFFQSFALKKVS